MRISVVMPVYNQGGFIAEAVRSVLSQASGGVDVELIIIDGGSTDNTLDILRGFGEPRTWLEVDGGTLRWVSEPDDGQSDAINKGMRLVRGEIVTWLNSDDYYLPGTLKRVAAAFDANVETGPRWIAGRVVIVDGGGTEFRKGVTAYKNRRLGKYTFGRLLQENFISQMGVFWRRELGEQVAYTDTAGQMAILDKDLHYTMDYDLWLRLGKAAEPKVLDGAPLAAFRLYAESKTGAFNREQYDEEFRVAKRHAGGVPGAGWSMFMHRLLVERTVLAYRVMKLLGL